MDVKTAQTRMEHANASIMLNWYFRAVPENGRKAADMLGELYAQKMDDKPCIIDLKTV